VAEAMSRWNNVLCERAMHGMFVTALLGKIIPSRREICYANAGHCPPMIVSKKGDVSEELPLGSPPLLIIPDIPIVERIIHLEPGDWFVTFTDGLTEAHDIRNQQLKEEGVKEVLSYEFAAPEEVVLALWGKEELHRGMAVAHDDLTMLVFGFQ